jgi:hypothetical protein
MWNLIADLEPSIRFFNGAAELIERAFRLADLESRAGLIRPHMTGTLKIHALVIIARVLLRIGGAAEDISAMCKRRAGRILDEAVAWCDARDAARRRARQG